MFRSSPVTRLQTIQSTQARYAGDIEAIANLTCFGFGLHTEWKTLKHSYSFIRGKRHILKGGDEYSARQCHLWESNPCNRVTHCLSLKWLMLSIVRAIRRLLPIVTFSVGAYREGLIFGMNARANVRRSKDRSTMRGYDPAWLCFQRPLDPLQGQQRPYPERPGGSTSEGGVPKRTTPQALHSQLQSNHVLTIEKNE